MPEERKDPILYEIINKVQNHVNDVIKVIVNEQYKRTNDDNDDGDGRKQIENEIQLKLKIKMLF